MENPDLALYLSFLEHLKKVREHTVALGTSTKKVSSGGQSKSASNKAEDTITYFTLDKFRATFPPSLSYLIPPLTPSSDAMTAQLPSSTKTKPSGSKDSSFDTDAFWSLFSDYFAPIDERVKQRKYHMLYQLPCIGKGIGADSQDLVGESASLATLTPPLASIWADCREESRDWGGVVGAWDLSEFQGEDDGEPAANPANESGRMMKIRQIPGRLTAAW